MRFHTLNDWLAWQERLHPEEIELGLERIARVWKGMQAPSSTYAAFTCPIISVAGTNGKGSSIAMLQAMYLAAGYRVGSYTSPHLYHYNERICLNGELVTDVLLIDAFQIIDDARQSIEPNISLTYFEFGTLAALHIFAQVDLDVILLEVGLGGRLDAVNIIDAEVALITSIDLDHQSWLGNSREEIAREKAGILRANKTCVISDPNTPAIIEQQAKEMDCTCCVSGQTFDYQLEQRQWRWQAEDKIRAGLPLPTLSGQQQLQNAAGVLMVIETLQSVLPVSQQAIRDGLLLASLPGRFEIRQISQGDISVVFDVAHNPAAAVSLAESIQTFCGMNGVSGASGKRRLLCVFAILADKDMPRVIGPLIPYVSHWNLASPSTARGRPVGEIEKELNRQLAAQNTNIMHEIQVKSHESVGQAILYVQNIAKPGDVILVYGSFYTVAEAGVEPV